MNLALWIIAGLLAVAYLASGGGKLIVPKKKIAAFGPRACLANGFASASTLIRIVGRDSERNRWPDRASRQKDILGIAA